MPKQHANFGSIQYAVNYQRKKMLRFKIVVSKCKRVFTFLLEFFGRTWLQVLNKLLFRSIGVYALSIVSRTGKKFDGVCTDL